MISQIRIENFQSHKETILNLDQGVNALIGLTGAGKSVVFKALEWLFRNRPLGDEYRSWWGGDTKVEIILTDNKQRIGRIRTDSDNYYYIDKKEFRAFGNGPPPQPVLDLLNLSEVNFQAQADPAFLISNSSGEVARYLNRAAHLDIIDGSLSNIAGTLRKEKEELSRAKQELELAQEQLIQYDWVPNAEEELIRLEGFEGKIFELRKWTSGVRSIVREYEQAAVALVAVQGVISFSRQFDSLMSLHLEIEKRNQEWEALAGIVDEYEKGQKELDALTVVAGYRGVWENVDVLYKTVFNLKSNRTGLKQVLDQIDWNKNQLKSAEVDHERLLKEFDKMMPNRCPLCEQEVKK